MAILNLYYLNVTLLQGTGAKKGKGAAKAKANDQGYDVSRYVPPLKRTVEDLLTSGLSTSEYPFVAPPDALLASARDDASKKKKGGGGGASGGGVADVPATGRRLIVFVLGGLSYSELRAMHELARAQNREILIGTTAMLTPQTTSSRQGDEAARHARRACAALQRDHGHRQYQQERRERRQRVSATTHIYFSSPQPPQ